MYLAKKYLNDMFIGGFFGINFYFMTIWCYNPDPNPVPDPGPQERKKCLVQLIAQVIKF